MKQDGAGLIVFTHTEIDDAYGGPRAGVDPGPCRARHRPQPRPAVRPDCPFVRAYVARHPDDYLDLVPVELRPRLGL